MKWFTLNIFLLRHWRYVRSRLWYIQGNPSVFMDWFTLNISSASYIWSLTVIYQETYACITLGRGKINFASHHADIMFCRVILKQKKKTFSEWFDEIVSYRSRNFNMYKRPFEYLLKKWSSTLFPSGKEKWCLKCPTIMVKANFTILQHHVEKYPIRMNHPSLRYTVRSRVLPESVFTSNRWTE